MTLKYVLLTNDPDIISATEGAFQPTDEIIVTSNVTEALDACQGAEMIFVDLLATLTTPNKIAGYELFADAKRAHPHAARTPLVLISPPEDYELDAFVGWPGFVLANLARPVTWKNLRRATTWV